MITVNLVSFQFSSHDVASLISHYDIQGSLKGLTRNISQNWPLLSPPRTTLEQQLLNERSESACVS